MDEQEDLETFTTILRTRYYNSGYREGLFKGKSEVIQEGFDRGYRLGALLSILKILESSLVLKDSDLDIDNLFGFDAEADIEIDDFVKEIVRCRNVLEKTVPEIKIATNLFPEAEDL